MSVLHRLGRLGGEKPCCLHSSRFPLLSTSPTPPAPYARALLLRLIPQTDPSMRLHLGRDKPQTPSEPDHCSYLRIMLSKCYCSLLRNEPSGRTPENRGIIPTHSRFPVTRLARASRKLLPLGQQEAPLHMNHRKTLGSAGLKPACPGLRIRISYSCTSNNCRCLTTRPGRLTGVGIFPVGRPWPLPVY